MKTLLIEDNGRVKDVSDLGLDLMIPSPTYPVMFVVRKDSEIGRKVIARREAMKK